ncbi:MAG: response regulator transcription factor [Flavobacteriales bacterium]|jgi:two-component system alkaline phosphatase synthesis response regulator PhoP
MKKSDIKILLVDDEPDILEIIGFNLENAGYQVFKAKDGVEALKQAKNIIPHLIIMDVMMPNLDGIEACDLIRKEDQLQQTVIMFLSARGEDFSYVAAFEAGADDYVTKPIKPKVLLSKVKGLLRRFKKPDSSEMVLKFGDLIIDKEEYKVTQNGQSFSLPRKEFELLFLLASKPEKVMKREKIMEKVWGNEVVVGDRTIDVHIRKLREKVGNDYFKTIKGVGYKFVNNPAEK